MEQEKIKKVRKSLVTSGFFKKSGDIFFGATSQHCEPKKISVRKTQKPQRFLGFFRAIFQGGIQKTSFPKNDLWGGLELKHIAVETYF